MDKVYIFMLIPQSIYQLLVSVVIVLMIVVLSLQIRNEMRARKAVNGIEKMNEMYEEKYNRMFLQKENHDGS